MKYYLIPKEEESIDILSENWCLGESFSQSFYTGLGWKAFGELITKSTDRDNLLNYYEVKTEDGNVIKWMDFLNIILQAK